MIPECARRRCPASAALLTLIYSNLCSDLSTPRPTADRARTRACATTDNPNDKLCADLALCSGPRGGQQVSGVVVLNTDNTALHTVSIKHAVKMLVRGRDRRRGTRGAADRPLPLAAGATTDPLRQDDVPLRQVTHLVQARRVAP